MDNKFTGGFKKSSAHQIILYASTDRINPDLSQIPKAIICCLFNCKVYIELETIIINVESDKLNG